MNNLKKVVRRRDSSQAKMILKQSHSKVVTMIQVKTL